MSYTRQYCEVPADDYDDSLTAAQWSRAKSTNAMQVQQVVFENPNGCAQEWASITNMDLRFVGAMTVDHLRQRALVVMHSASGEPDCVCTGADVNVLASWESFMPANFGGDGYGWFKVAYVSPNQANIDFSGTTGSLRFATWFTCAGDLPSGSGNHGDGVAIIHADNLEYTLTVGAAHSEVSVSMAALPLDALFLWIFPGYRSIDDITMEKTFRAFDDSFDHSQTRVNSEFVPVAPGGGIASSIDFHIDSRDPRAAAMTYSMQFAVDAVAGVFPNSCRVVASAFGADLRALCA